MEETDLHSADFFGAKLQGANMAEADLSRAILWMANLRATELSFTIGLTQEQIEAADGSVDTKLPSDLRMPTRWKT